MCSFSIKLLRVTPHAESCICSDSLESTYDCECLDILDILQEIFRKEGLDNLRELCIRRVDKNVKCEQYIPFCNSVQSRSIFDMFILALISRDKRRSKVCLCIECKIQAQSQETIKDFISREVLQQYNFSCNVLGNLCSCGFIKRYLVVSKRLKIKRKYRDMLEQEGWELCYI